MAKLNAMSHKAPHQQSEKKEKKKLKIITREIIA